MPPSVDVGRYTGYNIVVMMLQSRTDDVIGLTAKADDEHFEIAGFDEGGSLDYRRIKAGDIISIGKSPVFLVYRWGDRAEGAPAGPG